MKLLLLIALLLPLVSLSTAAKELLYKSVPNFEFIYNDAGSGADKDVSIWRPITTEPGYFAVGDVAVAGHGKPASGILVKEVAAGSLARPTGVFPIWSDQGSGGDYDVRVMSLNAPAGYTCLGSVAVLGYGSTPPLDKYRCVKSNLVVDGRNEPIWKDIGSGVDADVGFWRHANSWSDLYSINMNIFTAYNTHADYNGWGATKPKVLTGRHAEEANSAIVGQPEQPLKAYDTSDYSEIWNDKGSGADADFSIWRPARPSEFYALADVAWDRHHTPSFSTTIVKAWGDSEALQPPTGYRLVWQDGGSGADWDGSIWQAICPAGYRALGDVGVRSHGMPNAASTGQRCIKAEYTKTGSWAHVWKDSGSGADWDCRVWKAVTSGFSASLMSAVRHHGNMDRPAWVLDTSKAYFLPTKPIKKVTITDVIYGIADAEFVDHVEDLAITTLINRNGNEQEAWQTLTYAVTKEAHWAIGVATERGASIETSAGVPETAQSKVKVTVKVTTSFKYGTATATTTTRSIQAKAKVAANSMMKVTVLGTKYTTDVPFTANVVTYYMDGSTANHGRISGTFKGVNVADYRVQYGANEALPA